MRIPQESDPLYRHFEAGRAAGRRPQAHDRDRETAGLTYAQWQAYELGYCLGESEATVDTEEYDALRVRVALAEATGTD